MKHSLPSSLLIIEFVTLFLLLPLLLFFTGTRVGIYIALEGAGLYAFLMLCCAPNYSWKRLWHGEGWSVRERRKAFLRFLVLAAMLTVVTLLLVPEKFMRLPLDHFPFWLLIMVVYPILSVVPQELLFRSFFFARYQGLMPAKLVGILINGALFGFSHIVLNNWIAPTFCAVGGVLIAQSYQRHRSLKWAVIEHAFYGCWIFTVGVGFYFFTGNWRV